MDLPKKRLVSVCRPRRRKRRKGQEGTTRCGGKAAKAITLDDAKIFEPTLQIIAGKGKVINDLRKSAATADRVLPRPATRTVRVKLSLSTWRWCSPSPASTKKRSCRRTVRTAMQRRESRRRGSRCRKTGKGQGRPRSSKDKDELSVPAIIPKKIFRVTFNEITPKAIRAAFEKPRAVDMHLVDAQQARRVLDRIVGYKVSPLLWDKVRQSWVVGRARPDRGVAPDRRARAGNPRIRPPGILDHPRNARCWPAAALRSQDQQVQGRRH